MDNRSFEDRLRSELHDAVADVEAAPLPRAGARRARSRQLLAVAAVVAVAVSVGATTVTLLRGGGESRNDLAGNPEESPEGADDARGSGGSYPCRHPELNGECVAHGEYDGIQWWIGAHMEGDDLCTSDVHANHSGVTGSGMGCGPFDPDRIGFGVTSGDHYESDIASGEVASTVTRLVLERSEGSPIELQLYPAPPGFPLDVSFYSVFLPEDATKLVAYDSSGEQVAEQSAERAEFEFPQSEVVSPRVEIASGEEQGHPWSFRVHEELMNGDVTPCTDVMFGQGEEFGGGGSCYHGVLDKHPIGFSQSSFESGPDVIAVFGVVDAKATEVVVELDRGDAYTTDVLEAPDGFQDTIGYYVLWIPREGGPPNPPGRIIASDAEGSEVGREDLCGDIASEGGTCGN
jgi:hypothetical protein